LANIAEGVDKWAEELVRVIVTEVGKPIGEARAEMKQAVAMLRYYAQMVLAPDGEAYPAGRSEDLLITRRYPLGVCTLITPWNFPVAIPAWKLAPALGYANPTGVSQEAEAAERSRRLSRTVYNNISSPGFALCEAEVRGSSTVSSRVLSVRSRRVYLVVHPLDRQA
jgi:acyl-CoA reductase-like NAD-dependent aldehyde dehydrogenase